MRRSYKESDTFRRVVFIMTILLLIITQFPSLSFANTTVSEGYKSLGSVADIEPTKNWTITFNVDIDETTVTSNSVYVKKGDAKVPGVKVGLGKDKKTLVITAPNTGYLYNETYVLYIEDTIKSVYGVSMKEKVKYEFTIKTLDYSKFKVEDYFSKVEWIERDGVTSLSIYPKAYVIYTPTGHDFVKHIKTSFKLLEEKYGTDVQWKNGKSLESQYSCHVNFAGTSKVPWNIEPHRTTTDSWQMILSKCNPK